MRLAEFFPRVKARICHAPDLFTGVFVLLFIALIGTGAFFLDKIVGAEVNRKAELRIIQNGAILDSKRAGNTKLAETTSDVSTAPRIQGMYVASKTGTVYYAPWCGGVKLIHDENKVWFAGKEEAEAKGYKPAGNCKGI